MPGKHVKGLTGSKPLDAVGGVKHHKLTVKLNTSELIVACLFAGRRGVSTSELIRQLLKAALEAEPELHRDVIAGLKAGRRKARLKKKAGSTPAA